MNLFMKRLTYILLACLTMLAASSCSTTRVLQDEEYRLARNRIVITNDKEFNTNSLEPYLKQKPNPAILFGWNPFLYVYNWSNGKGKTWDKLVQGLGVEPVVYEADMVDATIENMLSRLTYIGYYGSTIESKIDVKKKDVNVTYNITLGKRLPIKDIEIVLPEEGTFAEDFLADTSAMLINIGDYLSEDILEKESVRSSAAMKNLGYYEFSKNNFFFEADTLSYPGSAVLKMNINEYTRNETPENARPISRYVFNDVTISYPQRLQIKERLLKELNTIRPGEPYSTDVVNNTYSSLASLRMFSSVNIAMTPVDSNRIDCRINMSQSKIQGFKVNLEASTNSTGLFGVSPQLSYYHKNIFKGGEWLNLGFMGNFQFKFRDAVRSNEFGVSAGLSFPRFLLLPYRHFQGAIPRTDINVSYNYQNRPEYTRNIISTSYGYNGNVNNRFFYQAYPVQLNVVRLFDLDEGFYKNLANDPFLKNAYQNHFDLGSGGTIYYTTDPETIPKSTYSYARLQVDIAGNLLRAFNGLMKKDENGSGMIWNTPYSQFVRGELTLGKTWIWGRNSGQSIAARLLAGAGHAYGNSTALPFEKHFYAGGANSLRGWQARTVGPGTSPRDTSFVIPNQTGDMRLEANVEYRFDMFWKVEGAVFADAGNVWTLKQKDMNVDDGSLFKWNTAAESIAANWGVGLRLNMDFLLLRVDVGFKVHDPARAERWVRPDQWLKNNGYALHFGVGYPF
jgi:outer membrane protein assembly factor BamA